MPQLATKSNTKNQDAGKDIGRSGKKSGPAVFMAALRGMGQREQAQALTPPDANTRVPVGGAAGGWARAGAAIGPKNAAPVEVGNHREAGPAQAGWQPAASAPAAAHETQIGGQRVGAPAKPAAPVDTFQTDATIRNHGRATHKTTAAVTNNVHPLSVVDPTSHPYYPTFQARITDFFGKFPPPPDFDPVSEAIEIWTRICESISSSDGAMDRAHPNTYSNPKSGWVDQTSAGAKSALHEFDHVMEKLKLVAESQFVKAKSFGFWSKTEGMALAEEKTDLTLETSGIGSLFDKIPSLNAHTNGWDPHLWGAMSNAFGESVAKHMRVYGKSVHVFAGGGTPKDNIFGLIESKALEKGAMAIGKSLEDAITFHSVAAVSKSKRVPDHNVKEGAVSGTWYSGHSWDTSLKIGADRFKLLPD